MYKLFIKIKDDPSKAQKIMEDLNWNYSITGSNLYLYDENKSLLQKRAGWLVHKAKNCKFGCTWRITI